MPAPSLLTRLSRAIIGGVEDYQKRSFIGNSGTQVRAAVGRWLSRHQKLTCKEARWQMRGGATHRPFRVGVALGSRAESSRKLQIWFDSPFWDRRAMFHPTALHSSEDTKAGVPKHLRTAREANNPQMQRWNQKIHPLPVLTVLTLPAGDLEFRLDNSSPRANLRDVDFPILASRGHV